MDFLITNYFYPIESKVLLSSHYDFWIDNPRTEGEISSIAHLIEESHEKNGVLRFPPVAENKYISLKHFLKEIRDSKTLSDPYVKEFFDGKPIRSATDVYIAMASMLLIVRYDDKGESKVITERVQLLREQGHGALALLDDDSPIIEVSKKLNNYGHLLSLLMTEEPSSKVNSFINSYDDSFLHKKVRYSMNLFYLGMLAMKEEESENHKNDDRHLFPLIQNDLLRSAKELDAFFSTEDPERLEKLEYVGEILKIVSEDVSDSKIRLVLLTSIVELMVTRNPDNQRFNVEDSISKQFRLKTAVIQYLAHGTESNLGDIEEELRSIYSLRSMIAHGDYASLQKMITKQKDKYLLDHKISSLYNIVRSILVQYLRDPNFVGFLKRS